MADNKDRAGGRAVPSYQWVDCDLTTVVRRYDRLAKHIKLFEWLLFLPRGLRERSVVALNLHPGDRVLCIGCGTGRNFSFLRDAVGSTGRIYGIDISPGMLARARAQCAANNWDNIELIECDAAGYVAPAPVDAVLFSLSYTTMPHHQSVLRNAWNQLRLGGRMVIMDAKLPAGFGGRLLLPFSLWLMKHTMLGNPLVRPWEELAEIADEFAMSEYLLGSYYICRATKRRTAIGAAIEHRIAAE